MQHVTLILLLAVALASAPGGLARQPAPQALAAPTLKWAYGGCFTSWCQTGWYASPAVADLDADGDAEVVWGSYDLVALSGATGALAWRAASGQRVWPSPAVADLDGDGSLEIAVGRGGDSLTVYNSAGGVVWSASPFGGGEVRTLAVADLDGDGPREVVVGRASGGSTRQVSAYTAAGALRSGWPARRDGEAGYGWGMYNQNVVVADLDGDGQREVIAPTDTHYITALNRNGGQLAASSIYGAGKVWSQVGVHVSHAVDLRGYANCGSEHRPNFANSAPAAADLDGDGALEVIVLGDVYNCAVGDGPGDMYLMPWVLNRDRTRWAAGPYSWVALPPDPGTRPLSQDYSVIENSVHNIVPADLDGDGVRELIFPSYDGRMYAYWLDKSEHGSWPYDVPGSGIRFASEPAVVDLDGDGSSEVIFTSWPEKVAGRVGQLHVLSAQGVSLFAVSLPAPRGGSWNGGLGAPTVANIDADAELEVVVGTAYSGVVAYDLPGSTGGGIRWGTGRGSNLRSGVAQIDMGFTLRAASAAAAVPAGGVASYPLALSSGDAPPADVSLSVSVTPPGPTAELSVSSALTPAQLTLTLTDNHAAGPLQPGQLYHAEVTATSGGRTQRVTVALLVGGQRVALPQIRR